MKIQVQISWVGQSTTGGSKNFMRQFLFGKDKDAPCDEAKKDMMVLIVAVGIGDLVVFVLVATDVLGVVASDDLGAGGNPRVHA